jgi:DNA-binding MarR family transcriptional regulator
MANHKRDLVTRVAECIPKLQEAMTKVDEAAAAVLGVNLTDLHCLAILLRQGKAAASQLAHLLGLTRGAVTTVLDRLERVGLAKRIPDPKDRRGVLVEVTATARKRVQAIWGPIGKEGMIQLVGYSSDELRFLHDFLEKARTLQESHAKRIRALSKR